MCKNNAKPKYKMSWILNLKLVQKEYQKDNSYDNSIGNKHSTKFEYNNYYIINNELFTYKI